jgi:Zn-dependent peptidase ImmA (M78 family)
MTAIPVSPAILKWARESRGLTTAQVATSLGRKRITADTIADWESGNGSPTFPQLEALAYDVYKRPLAVFFFPAVPEEETPRGDLRTLPGALVDEIQPGLVMLYRKAKLYQMNLRELSPERPTGPSPLTERLVLGPDSDVTGVASSVRHALGISIDEQATWPSPEAAVKFWRAAFEATGIAVFKDAFKADAFCGLCLYDDMHPVILVNNSTPFSRQVFTLFHELGHLLHHSGGVDFRGSELTRTFDRRCLGIEERCNRFAHECLVPTRAFRELAGPPTDEGIQALADHFSVSREVILRGYVDSGIVDSSAYESTVARWASQAVAGRNRSPGGSYYYNMHSYLGDDYINLVYSRYHQQRITAEQAADYLGVKLKSLATLEHVTIEGGRP